MKAILPGTEFSKVLYIVTLYSMYTRTLTVENFLLASFAFRRANRGLESIAVSGDKTRAYTCQQVIIVGKN